jgi:small-conductance mechanosensitive channel
MHKELAVWAVAGTLVITSTLLSFAGTEQNKDGQESKQDLFYEVESLNEALTPLDDPPDLSTPRAALVNFFLASRDGRFKRAARSLNLQTIPDKERLAARYAMKLYYVISQKIDVEYKKVPDRPSGAFEEATDDSDSPPESSQPQRSIKLGEVSLSLGHVEIRLERFKPQDGEPVWLFSPRTTEKIQEMYERHGPGPFFDHLPFLMKQGLLTGSPHWQWLLLIAVGSLAGLSAWGYQKLARVVGSHVAPPRAQKEAMRLATPIGALLGLLTFYIVTYKLISPPGEEVRTLFVISFMFIVAGLTWTGIRFIDLFSAQAARKFDLVVGTYQEEEARVRYTRISVGRHILIFLAVCVGLALALYQLQVIKNLSLSFLASASVVGVILGVTAPAVLGNTLAGLQIAMTRPVAIGDSIHFEGHWGFVEDITYAYIAIQTWDRRRVIVPISYFISHPFENWSKSDTRILQPIYLYADYHVDVDAVRQKFRELLERSDNWDQTLDPIIQVTGMSEKGIELRALFYAKDPGKGWDLHCELREGLISFLQTVEGGRYLPKHRVELSDHHGKEGISGTEATHGENPSLNK